MMKKIIFLGLIAIGLSSCKAPVANENTSSGNVSGNGRYQMTTIENSENKEILIFVLDTKTGKVSMRGSFSGTWLPQGGFNETK